VETDRFGNGDGSLEKKRPLQWRRRPGAVKTFGAGARRPDEISDAAAASSSAAHVLRVYVRFRRRF